MPSGEIALEPRDFRTHDIGPVVEHPKDGLVDGLPKGSALCAKVDKGDQVWHACSSDRYGDG
jgi:hypothetical protein